MWSIQVTVDAEQKDYGFILHLEQHFTDSNTIQTSVLQINFRICNEDLLGCTVSNPYAALWSHKMVIMDCVKLISLQYIKCFPYNINRWKSSHPSIHFLYRLIRRSGRGGGWSLSQRSSGGRRGTPWTGRQSVAGPHRDKRDKQPHTLTLTPKEDLESPINRWEEAGVPGENPAYTGRTCKLHTERPQVGIEPLTVRQRC